MSDSQNRQFLRQYDLMIGESGKGGLHLTSEDKSNDTGITGLRVYFEIVKDSSSKTNKSKIKIWNLSDKSLDIIEKEDIMIDLSVGYKEDIGPVRIFIGTSASVKTKEDNNGMDVVTEIEALDGGIAVRDSIVSMSAPQGASTVNLVKACAKKMGLAYNISSDVEDKPYPNGFSFCNYSRYLMDTLCEKLGASWSIQNGIAQITLNKGTSGYKGVKFNASTGLIGRPERMVISSKVANVKFPNSTTETKTIREEVETTGKRFSKKKIVETAKKSKTNEKTGWKIKTLLAPTVIPGEEVEIESNSVVGRFKVDKVTHTGDIYGSDWFSEIEVVEIPK